MFPVLIRIGPVTVHTYGFMMALGVATALWFFFIQSKKQDLPASKLVDMAFYTIIISLIGAKVVLLVGNFSHYVNNPSKLFSLARSGGVFQGGLAAGILFAAWFLNRHKIPKWKVSDIIAPTLALGHTFGRLGCLSAGCCFGRECTVPWGVTFSNEKANALTGIPLGITRHPVQIYEAVLNFLNFLFLFLLLRKKKFDGQIFSLYIINYSVIRYITEFYRGDHPDKVYVIKNSSAYLSLSFPQVFCILGIICGIVLMVILRKRKVA